MPHDSASTERRLGTPHACASGVVLYLNSDARSLVAVPTYCHRWDCPTCGKARAGRAQAIAASGKPERMITLTTRPRKGLSLDGAVRWIRGRWTVLLKHLRREFPRIEYMAFVEMHKSGWPHMHILTRGCYIPQRLLSRWWQDLTGSHRVHIEAYANTWKAIHEATKYYLKTARAVHDAAPRLPVYTKSRGWLPEDWNEDKRPTGSYTFYAFCRMNWQDLLSFLDVLDIDIVDTPDHPGHFTLSRAGPLEPRLTEEVYACGSWAELELISALDLYFADPARAHRDPVLLKDRQEYTVNPERSLMPAPDDYTTDTKASLDVAFSPPPAISQGVLCPF